MRNRFPVMMMALFFAGALHAQQEVVRLKGEDSVRQVVSRLMSALARSDVRAYYACFVDTTATIETVVRDRRGFAQVRKESLLANINAVMSQPAGSIIEQFDVASVKIDGALAHAWVPYKFYYAGKLQYCGAHSFHMIRLIGTWKIFYMIETRNPAGSCAELPGK